MARCSPTFSGSSSDSCVSYWTVPTSKLITRQQSSTVRLRSFQIAYICHSWSLNCLFCRRRRSPQHSGDHNFWLLPQLRSLRRSRPCPVPHHRNAHLDSAPRRNQPLHGLSIHKRPSTLTTRFLPLLRNNVSPTEITELLLFGTLFYPYSLRNGGLIKSSGSRFLEAEEITLDELAKKGNFMPRASIKNGGGRSQS